MNLTETLEPGYARVSENRRIANSLTLSITNQGTEPVEFGGNDGEAEPAIASILFYFPLSTSPDDPDKHRSLTSLELAREIAVYPPENWQVEKRPHQFGLAWALLPREPHSLPPKESLTFTIANIVTTAPDFPANRLSFLALGYEPLDGEVFLPISLIPPELEITHFSLDPTTVAGVGDDIAVAWTVDGADQCRLTPGDYVGRESKGLVNWRVDTTTTFALYATGDDRTISKAATVRVVDGKAVKLTADRPECSFGDEVSLHAEVADCGHAWLNAGIGRFPISGKKTITVVPQKRWNRYVLSAETAEGAVTTDCTVLVKNRLELVYCSLRPAANNSRLVSWEVAGATSCLLKDSAGNTVSTTSKGANLAVAAGALTIECQGEKNQSFKKVFP